MVDMDNPMGTYMTANDTCSGWVEISLDIFVIVKALILIYYSIQGITWFLKNKFSAIAVIIVLLVSCFLVSQLHNLHIMNIF